MASMMLSTPSQMIPLHLKTSTEMANLMRWNDGFDESDSTSQPPLTLDTDDDNDGVPDESDCYPVDGGRTICDADLDGIADNLDNCPATDKWRSE